MAIGWGKQAWEKVSPDTIIKCFEKTKMYPQEEEEDDPFEGEELPALQDLTRWATLAIRILLFSKERT